jgi:tetratricopeptide (TPR) repeat protein
MVLTPAARAGRDKPASPAKRAKADAAAAAAAGPPKAPCKEPAPKDPALVAGLDHYLAGRWGDAVTSLKSWAETAGADSEPAAGRGFYSLAYALVQSGQRQAAGTWFGKAQPVLEAPPSDGRPGISLEADYYLASLHENRGDAAAQLQVVARALRELEAGTLCPDPDGDDLFRQARLMGFAGRQAEKVKLLERAEAAYAAGSGAVTTYRVLLHQELGRAARDAGDVAAWERHFTAAAALDPKTAGVHLGLGLAKLRQGDVKGAADHWRRTWRLERQNGNALVYAVAVLDKVVRHRGALGEAHRITNLADYTMPALEENALQRGRELARAVEALAAAGTPPPAELEAQRTVADYEMAQFLTEMIARGADIQEFALRSGLVGAIMARDLPGGR